MVLITISKSIYLTLLYKELDKKAKEIYDYEKIDEVKCGIRNSPYSGPSSVMFRKEISDIEEMIRFVNMAEGDTIQVSKEMFS